MIFHPPLLYMGYVGMAVVFAFAIAALWVGDWMPPGRAGAGPWTIAAWIFLTCGIALGGFWAYLRTGLGRLVVLGPGGNASFMPWLVGTALIHSLAVTEKRGAFKAWTVLLAIAAFSLSLLGTFLVRSGVLTSVHAFATDPRGIFILTFPGGHHRWLADLYALRAPKVNDGGRFGLLVARSLPARQQPVAGCRCRRGDCWARCTRCWTHSAWARSVSDRLTSEIVFVPADAAFDCIDGVGPNARWKDDDLFRLLRRMSRPPLPQRVAFVACALLGSRFRCSPVAAWRSCSLARVGVIDGYRDRLRHASGMAERRKCWPADPACVPTACR